MNRRPKLEFATSIAATPEEAAAVIAAVEQFLRDTTPPPAPRANRPNPWQRTARLESVGREQDALTPWGDPHPWGASL